MIVLTEELKQKAQEAKKAKMLFAEQSLKLDWGDESHWKELAKKLNVKMPVWYHPNTNVKFLKRLFKKVGIDIKEYVQDMGYSTLTKMMQDNPHMPAYAEYGFALEYISEKKGSTAIENE